MHFAYPPRKSSNPPPFRPKTSKIPLLRKSRLKTVALVLLAIVGVFWLFSGSGGQTPYREPVPSGNPPVVVVTVIDPTRYSNIYLQTIKENREAYASRHGYQSMIVNTHDYDTLGAPQSWSKIIAMRHAITKFPDAKYIWQLSQNAYIMDLTKSLEEQLAEPKRLESLMIRDTSVVPESIIKTFKHLRANDVELIMGRDAEGLVSDSVVIRNGDWAKYFIETWMDPLYRSYNFQKAERHALEHIVQWHPTVLSKLALVPQRNIASYTRKTLGEPYQDGDFVVVLAGCVKEAQDSCEKESQPYARKLKAMYGSS